jgi:hypothetical protein
MTPKELEHFKDCEAREWTRRYKAKKQTIGLRQALLWWQAVLLDLQQIRGESDTLDLRQRMNRIQDETSRKG